MKDLTQEILDNLSSKLEVSLKNVIAEVLEKEVSKALAKTLLESEFYRNLSEELRSGLKNIYNNIEKTKKTGLSQQEASYLFNETSNQLDAILRTTEQATMEIMGLVEKHLDQMPQIEEICQRVKKGQACPEDGDTLLAWQKSLNQDLLSIVTSLSFQDLTGQRIKKIVDALRQIEEQVFQLYVSSSLSLKVKEKNPDKDFEEIKQEAQVKMSELKGPQEKVKQEDVDELLAELGL
ncbi:protein phosphatase CheZ [Desulfonauticus submarinus]